MNRALPPYSYQASIKSTESDELINIYLQRPIAGVITFFLYYTPITPNQVTILSTFCGMAGGIVLGWNPTLMPISALLFYLKDILDSADGQLARAKQMYSRVGRFLDSIGDYIVHVFLFGGITFALLADGMPVYLALALAITGFIGISLRVSYHVFYQTMFLHSEEKYLNNRVTEELRPDDYTRDRFTLLLQKTFQFLYGWQDRLMVKIDNWCFGSKERNPENNRRWYRDKKGIRFASMTGLGTEFVTLTICFLCSSTTAYLTMTIVISNLMWLGTMIYRKKILTRYLTEKNSGR